MRKEVQHDSRVLAQCMRLLLIKIVGKTAGGAGLKENVSGFISDIVKFTMSISYLRQER